jgi:shikimate dehydrogenase
MAGPEETVLAFPEPLISLATYVFDVVALPIETPLLAKARLLGKHLISGADVATIQSLEQFVLYTGIRPSESQFQMAVRFACA